MRQPFYIEPKLRGCFENVSTGSNSKMSSNNQNHCQLEPLANNNLKQTSMFLLL